MKVKGYIFLVFISLFFSVLNSYGQYMSRSEVEKYLRDNIDDLDPIEGIWDRQITVIQVSPYYGRKEERGDGVAYAILKQGDKFIGYSLENEDFYRSLSASNFSRIGTYRMYEINDFVYDKYRFSINDKDFFEITKQLSQKEERKIFESHGVAGSLVKVIFKEEYNRIFPTSKEYEEAYKKKEERIWQGSGFALNDRYIVTNYHVVEEAKTISVLGVNGSNIEYKASVVTSDKNNDLAIIKISDERFVGFGKIPYKISTRICDVGEDIFVLGYPLSQYMGDEIKLTNGIISSRTGFQGDVSTYQISAPVQPGNSGGPLFDKNGNVVGIINAGITAADNVGYAIKAPYLRTMVVTGLIESALPKPVNNLSALSLSEKVKRLRDFVFFIKCENK